MVLRKMIPDQHWFTPPKRKTAIYNSKGQPYQHQAVLLDPPVTPSKATLQLGKPHLIRLLNLTCTPILKWCEFRCGSKSGCQKDIMCL